MKLKRLICGKWFVLWELIMVLSWLTKLNDSDSYFFISALCAMAGCLAIWENCRNSESLFQKKWFSASILAAVYSLSSILANYSLFVPFPAWMTLFDLLCSFLGGFFLALNVLVYLTRRLSVSRPDKQLPRHHPVKCFLLCFASISVIDGLYLIVSAYPGILTSDSVNQVSEILSGSYSNLNPYWHTRTIGLFLNLGGKIFGTLQAGVAVYSVFQIMFMAATLSYGIVTLYQQHVPKWCIGLVWGAYALAHYNISYSVTMWKDILFSCACLLSITALYRMVCHVKTFRKLDMVIFILSGFGLCLWRTNGLLVYAVMMAALLAMPSQRRMLAPMSCVLLVCLLLNGPVLSALHVAKGSYVEALSIPLQQIARVIHEERTLTPEEEALVTQIADLETIRNAYDCEISDPIKGLVVNAQNGDPLREHPMLYLRLWRNIGSRYPADYLKAWIEQTKGYWNGGYRNWIVAQGIFDNHFELYRAPKGGILGQIYDGYFRYTEVIPFLQPFYSIGFQTWLMILCCYISIRNGNPAWILTLCWFSVLFGLLIGTPVFSEFRYAYPLILSLPLTIALSCFPNPENTQ